MFSMDFNLLQKLARELDDSLKYAVISKVYTPIGDDRTLILKLFNGKKNVNLVISSLAQLNRIHLTNEHFTHPMTPKRFTVYLRKKLKNGRIEDIRQKENENIIIMKIKTKEDSYLLHIELTGNGSNIILTDRDMTILDSLRHFKDDSKREVRPGIILKDLPEKEEIEKKSSTIKIDETLSINENLENYYAPLYENFFVESFKRELSGVIKKEITKKERLFKNLKKDELKAKGNIDNRLKAELLLANIHTLKKGEKKVVLQNYYLDPPENMEIEISEKLSPKANIELYFKKAKKGDKTLKHLEERVPREEGELKYLKEVLFFIEKENTVLGLDEKYEELKELNFIKEDKKGLKTKQKQRPKKDIKEPYLKLKTTNGLTMLLGKSSIGNDKIIHLASKEDLWLHAYESPSAHVIIKRDGKEITESDIIEAGRLCIENSKLKNEKKATVMYALVKDVKKPKKAKPGLVTVDKFKTILIS